MEIESNSKYIMTKGKCMENHARVKRNILCIQDYILRIPIKISQTKEFPCLLFTNLLVSFCKVLKESLQTPG